MGISHARANNLERRRRRKRNRVESHQGTEGIVQPEIERQRLHQFEEGRVVEFDGIRRNVFLHSVLTGSIRV